jgi:hypothetical protein
MLRIALSEFGRRLQKRYSPQMLVNIIWAAMESHLAVPTMARETTTQTFYGNASVVSSVVER